MLHSSSYKHTAVLKAWTEQNTEPQPYEMIILWSNGTKPEMFGPPDLWLCLEDEE